MTGGDGATVAGTANDAPITPALFTSGKRDYIPDAKRVGDGMQAGDVCAFRLGKFVHVALKEEDFLVVVLEEGDAFDVVFEAAHVVHAAGAKQFAQCVDEAGAADSFGLHVADYAKTDGAIGGDGGRRNDFSPG